MSTPDIGSNEIWAEVYDPNDLTMLGVVMLISASITKPLDVVGAISIVTPTTDQNAVELLQIWRLVRVYWKNAVHGKTLIGGMILISESLNINSAQTTWSGQNRLYALRRVNTWRGLEYVDQPFDDVIDDLVAHVPNWSAVVEPGLGNTSRRFDGQSILRALLMTIQGKGVHLRLTQEPRARQEEEEAIIPNAIEVGAFGDDSGFRMTNLTVSTHEVQANPELIIISTLSVIEDGFDVMNRVEPVWGNGDAVLTLRKSTRTSPYPILTAIGPDGRTRYYLEDTASIAQYGAIEGILSMQDAPYVAADGGASVINAADVLYDWAAAKLSKISQPKKTYQTNGLKLDKLLRPGDKLRLVYKGQSYSGGVKVVWLDIDDLFWVLSLTETYNMRGQSVSIQISNIDDKVVDATGMIADSLISQETERIQQTLTSSNSRYSEDVEVRFNNPGEFYFNVQETTVAIGRTTLFMERPDPSRPDTISIAIDGIDRTSELGGPWFVGALDNDPVEVDIDEILDVGDVRGQHVITISAGLRIGDITTSVEITEIGVSL